MLFSCLSPAIDLFFGLHLRNGDEEVMIQVRDKISPEKDRPESSPSSTPPESSQALFDPKDKFIKRGRRKGELAAPDPGDDLLCILRLAQVHQRQLSQTLFPEAGEKNRCHQGTKPFIRADIGGGPFSPDVLLSRRQGEDKASLPFQIDRLTNQPARHVSNKFSRVAKIPR